MGAVRVCVLRLSCKAAWRAKAVWFLGLRGLGLAGPDATAERRGVQQEAGSTPRLMLASPL